MNQSSKDILVSVFARTNAGLRRPRNEDAFMIADLTTGKIGLGPDMVTHRVGERGSLIVVSDGMGGAAAGEIASEMAVKTVRESLMTLSTNFDESERLRIATKEANDRIWSLSNQDLKLKGMGATLTAALVQRDTVFVAQVGDSRAYLFRGDRVKQLTKDQSLVQALVDAGAVAPDETDTIPHNVITQALGTSASVEVEISCVELCKDDVLIACSDGLSNKVKDYEMLRYVQQISDLTLLCRTLIELANKRGGEDNITIVAARFDGEMLRSAAEGNSISGSFKILSPSGVNTEPITDSFRRAVDSIGTTSEDELDATTLVFNPIDYKDPSTEKE